MSNIFSAGTSPHPTLTRFAKRSISSSPSLPSRKVLKTPLLQLLRTVNGPKTDALKTDNNPKNAASNSLSTIVSYIYPIGSMYGIYGNIYHQYTPNVSIYTIHGSYGYIYIMLNQLCYSGVFIIHQL